MDYKVTALIVGAYVAVIANTYFVWKVSNHWGTKLDGLKDAFNNFRVEISKDIGRIDAQVKQLLKFNMTDKGL